MDIYSKERIREKLDNMSREEFIDMLERAGFEVEDGDGKVIFKGEEE